VVTVDVVLERTKSRTNYWGKILIMTDQLQYSVGTVVQVESRTWKGINKPGGTGEVTKIWKEDEVERVNVKYFFGGTEKRLELCWVKPQKFLDRTNRRREPRKSRNNIGPVAILDKKENKEKKNRSYRESSVQKCKATFRRKGDGGFSKNIEVKKANLSVSKDANETASKAQLNLKSTDKIRKTTKNDQKNAQSRGQVKSMKRAPYREKGKDVNISRQVKKLKTKALAKVKIMQSKTAPRSAHAEMEIKEISLGPIDETMLSPITARPGLNNSCPEKVPERKKTPFSDVKIVSNNIVLMDQGESLVKKDSLNKIGLERIEIFTSILSEIMRCQTTSDSMHLDDLVTEMNSRTVSARKFSEVEIRSCMKTLENENKVYFAEDSGMVYRI